jgi:rod shape determining protein RodA
VAKYFSDLHDRELSWSDFLKAGAIVGIPMLLVWKQPDLGTALTYLPIAVMGLFLGGLRWRQAGVVLLLAALAMPLAWHHMKDYQKQRLVSFREPDADPKGSGYQVSQSLIAVGSGGIFGSSQGSQTKLAFCRSRKPTLFLPRSPKNTGL